MTEKQMISTLKELTFGTVVGSKGVEALEMAIQALSQGPCGDAISREDAIKAQCEACDICGNMRYTKCQYFMQGCNEVKCLRDLPSVTPTCEEREKGECPYYAG